MRSTGANSLTIAAEDMITLEQAKELIKRADERGYLIGHMSNVHNAKVLRQAFHETLAERLIEARNKSGLNNDKINRKMLGAYIHRRRTSKSWAFTNIVSPKTRYLPDEEEVELLAEILNTDKELLSLHLRLAPWLVEQDQERRRAKESKPRRARKTSGEKTMSTKDPVEARHPDPRPEAQWTRDQTGQPQPEPRQGVRDAQVPMHQTSAIPNHAGELKISHVDGKIQVHGKVWCDQKTVQKLRMIVPLKLINQAKNDDPWCYEIKGPVHGYQLHSLMHVLYGAPRVISVEM